MKNKSPILLLSLLFFPALISAQVNIKATVYNENKEIIPIANVLLLDQDKKMVHGEVLYDGNLNLEWSYLPAHTLKISALGWSDKTIQLQDCQSGCDFGKITLERSSINLEEVVVTEKIQLFEAKDGIIQVNVENTILSEKESLTDVLRSSPGIFVRDESTVEIFGKGNARIYIDNVEIQSTDILQSLSPSEVKKIEIIQNPSAKYGAEGKAVIHIYTRNNTLEGVLGQVRLGNSKNTYQSAYYSADLSINKGKYSFYASGNWNPYKLLYEEKLERKITNSAKTSTLDNDIKNTKTAWLNNNYRTKLGYKINAKQNISLEFRGKTFDENINKLNQNNIQEGSDTPYTIRATSIYGR